MTDAVHKQPKNGSVCLLTSKSKIYSLLKLVLVVKQFPKELLRNYEVQIAALEYLIPRKQFSESGLLEKQSRT